MVLSSEFYQLILCEVLKKESKVKKQLLIILKFVSVFDPCQLVHGVLILLNFPAEETVGSKQKHSVWEMSFCVPHQLMLSVEDDNNSDNSVI